ncbi:MAG: EamA family transporter [Clostridia bacterium]|nr:EamA family transporter [Clostridia bacterium]
MLTLPIPLLLVITILTSALISVTRGAYSKNLPADDRNLWFFNLVQSVCCALMILLVMGGIGKISGYTVMLGAILGAVSAFQLLFNLKAYSVGPFSYTMVIVSLSTIIPTVSGLFFGETISPVQWIGIVLMAVCIILSPDSEKGAHAKKSGVLWLLFCIPATLLSGTVGVLQKIHQTSAHASEKAAFLVSAFAVSTVISLIFLLCSPKSAGHEYGTKKDKIIRVLLPVITGVGFAFPHTINLYLAGVLTTAVMFPLVNIIPMVLSTITAMLMFRERLSLRRWIGVIIGVISTILVSGMITI